MRFVQTGGQSFQLLSSAGTTATGAGAWHDLKSAYSKFTLQAMKKTTGTTAYTIVLQGTLTTLSTGVFSLISYTVANNNVPKVSTGTIPPVTKIRYNVTVLGGTSAASPGFGVKNIYAAWGP